MKSMNKLADLLEKKRKAKREVENIDVQKSVKQARVETTGIEKEADATQAKTSISALPLSQKTRADAIDIPTADIKRKLRLLRQPITLFGENDQERSDRLLKAQEEVQVEDEHIEGVQVYNQLQVEKERKEKERLAKLKAAQPTVMQEPAKDDEEASTPEDPVAAEFAKAAAQLQEKLAEQGMIVEDRILKYLQRYCTLWEEDLDRRPEAVKDSGPGRQATLQFKQTVSYFKALYAQLKRRSCPPEMVAGIWMLIEDIQQRNYLQAYDIYMHLAVGNAPWPIGVTSIGIHDRSAREKIGHTMNAAHIMNDEATRKYLQGLKRLLTFMQRVFPTDPSRAVDFDGFRDVGRGAAGSGSDKQALIEAEASGKLALMPAPHRLDVDGSVKVPEKWENMVKRTEAYKQNFAKTPPNTPPR